MTYLLHMILATRITQACHLPLATPQPRLTVQPEMHSSRCKTWQRTGTANEAKQRPDLHGAKGVGRTQQRQQLYVEPERVHASEREETSRVEDQAGMVCKT